MHRSLSTSSSQGPFPSGMLIASEFDSKRAKLLLAGRVRHLTTPNCLIGIAPAQSLPETWFGDIFDRVLVDVPCSGDGTIRKEPRLVTPTHISRLQHLNLYCYCVNSDHTLSHPLFLSIYPSGVVGLLRTAWSCTVFN